jgi:flagellar assembly protein FliH
MNMSARVLKNAAAAAAIPLSIGFQGDAMPTTSGLQPLIVPEIEPIEYIAPPPVHFEEIDELEPADLLAHAQVEAQRIIAQAEQQATVIENAANERAVSRAKAELEVEHADKYSELRNQLTATIAQVGALDSEINGNLESEVVELALQAARKIVAREVTIDRDIALTLVKVSLAKLHNRVVAEIHLHPEDFAYVRERLDQIDYRGKIELVEDRSISLGGCVIHTETGDIDARIESQFDELAHGLMN